MSAAQRVRDLTGDGMSKCAEPGMMETLVGHVDLELDAETWSVAGCRLLVPVVKKCTACHALKMGLGPNMGLAVYSRVFASSHGRAAGESWSSCFLSKLGLTFLLVSC